ncbi:MAG: hypothetical protein JSS27_02465 [Planctomycetes bacterium]|nr:hypothetical protein [Planctomycetota bacterium]
MFLPTITLLLITCLTPAEAVAAALADLATQPTERHGQTRYLLLLEADAAARQTTHQAVSFLLNSVSRTRTITVPPRVGADGWLIRVDLAAWTDFRQPQGYQELFAAWERLARDDPYFHLRTQVLAKGKLREVTTDGGWVGLEPAAQLREMTGSFGAVLRADYFISAVAAEAYYEWAGIPATEAEFFRQFGVDPDEATRLSADSAANLLRSRVTQKPRRIIQRPGLFGGVWHTKDVDGESPDRDPVRNPIDFAPQRFNFQASEFFAMGANRLWRVALYDAAGRRQETVPDRVAKDFTGDGIIRPLVSCLRCHDRLGGQSGLQPFADDQAELMARVGLQSYEPQIAQRLQELYDPARLHQAMQRDREDYAAAVALATDGMTPKEAIDALVAVYTRYVDVPVTLSRAAEELCVSEQQLAAALAESRDPMALALVLGKSINRAAWASAFGDAALRVAAHASPNDTAKE